MLVWETVSRALLFPCGALLQPQVQSDLECTRKESFPSTWPTVTLPQLSLHCIIVPP